MPTKAGAEAALFCCVLQSCLTVEFTFQLNPCNTHHPAPPALLFAADTAAAVCCRAACPLTWWHVSW